MRPLPNHDIALLILDLREEFRQLLDCNSISLRTPLDT